MKTLPDALPEKLSRWAYAALMRLLTPFYMLRLWRRGAAEPLYRSFLGERLGFYARPAGTQGWIWIHAVSLGETRAAAALLDALRQLRPNSKFLLTHSTATGRAAGHELLQPGDVQAWLPFDTPPAVKRFLRHWQPAIGVLMETEIWPVLLCKAVHAKVPMVLANARLSERSQRKGERFKALLHPAARRLALTLAQTEADALRLRASGAAPVLVCGNLKFDMQPDAGLLAQGRQWRASLARPVLLFAVTREGEEAMLLAAWLAKPLTASKPPPLLLLVPRHPQRFEEVAALITQAGLSLARRSSWQDLLPEQALQADVWLGDSMREMALYYAVADVALLGGSFAPLGGQNLIEAAACGCPVVMGPHTFNFAEAAELAAAAGAALRVADMTQGLTQALVICAEAEHTRATLAGSFAAAHRGAAEKMAREIIGLI